MGRAAARGAGNLPAELTSFVDRRRDLDEVTRLLSASRLVTLTGPGGVGKTRLALRVAAKVRRAFRDGVWLVELARVHAPALVAPTVAQALGIYDGSGREPVELLAEYLRGRQVLVVLDDCERVVDACATLAAGLLRQAEPLRILATSREVLHAAGEHVWAVGPLPVGATNGTGPPDPAPGPGAGLDSPAVELFAERGAAVVPTFAVTAENRATVAEICRGLDGLPLAIELAAALLRALSAEQIRCLLGDRFVLLTNGSRVALPRHQTLRAAVDWSFDLCTVPEQQLWARAAVFDGGFDLDAAELVCAGDDLARAEIWQLLAGLVDKSVLLAEKHGQRVRYRMLETLREYGLQRLRDSGREAARRAAHVAWCLELAERAGAEWLGPRQDLWYARLRREHANLRAAMDFALTAADHTQTGVRLAAALWFYWHTCGLIAEGRYWLDRALAADPRATRYRAGALLAVVFNACTQGDVAAGASAATEAYDLARRLEDPALEAWARYRLGMVALFGGDLPRAEGLMREAMERLTALRGSGHTSTLIVRGTLSAALMLQNDLVAAAAVAEEVREGWRSRGERIYQGYLLSTLARIAWARGDLERAVTHARDAVRLRRTMPEPNSLTYLCDLLAGVAERHGQDERAAVLLGAADGLCRSFGLHGMLDTFGGPGRNCRERVRRALGDEAYAAALRRGGELTLADLIAYTLEEPVPPAPPPPAGETEVALAFLTRRERQVAELVAEGLSNKQIAAELLISQRTAETHVGHIMEKLRVTSRSQIATSIVEARR